MRGKRIGVIAEGAEDVVVLRSIFRALGFDGSEIRAIRPDLGQDATDRHHNQATIGTFQGVKNACCGVNGVRDDFDRAFGVLDCDYIAIQCDTAEIETHNFAFTRPADRFAIDYCRTMRSAVIALIDSWLEGQYSNKLLYAISIEEIEAWCLTASSRQDTATSANPKAKLQSEIARRIKKNIPNSSKRIEEYLRDMDFHKKKRLMEYAENNKSLQEFILSVDALIPLEEEG